MPHNLQQGSVVSIQAVLQPAEPPASSLLTKAHEVDNVATDEQKPPQLPLPELAAQAQQL